MLDYFQTWAYFAIEAASRVNNIFQKVMIIITIIMILIYKSIKKITIKIIKKACVYMKE